MTSPNIVIGYHKLDTKFFTGHVQHTTFHSDASQGRRRVKEVKNWYRDREIGRGTFGTVFLERSEGGECRAVKEIAKGSSITIDYRRELMAMAILAKHDALFIQLFGWYENDNYVHIAMEYISHGHLRKYLEVERSESEAKDITRQLLEGLVVIHQEGFAHRDLKPENIFVVSPSPVWVKIGDFGLAKLVRDGTAFRTQAFSRDYIAPEVGADTSRETSEYTNAVDIWAIGCIAHEMLTRVPPFRNLFELCSYCTRPEFPRGSMLLKNISEKGMEIVERMLALRPERRITAKEALDSEWLGLEDEGREGLETEEVLAGPALPEVPAPLGRSARDRRVQKHPATFQCALCPKRFSRAYNLRSHLRLHTDERPFVCAICGKAFARQHDRRRHEGLHSGEKKFVCRGSLKAGGTWGCGRQFAQADALGRHFRSEAGRLCIRPLLEEETAERQRNQMLARGQVLGPTMGQLSSNSDAPGMPLGGMVAPSLLLEQYPAFANMAWGSLPPGANELGDGGNGSNRSPLAWTRAGENRMMGALAVVPPSSAAETAAYDGDRSGNEGWASDWRGIP